MCRFYAEGKYKVKSTGETTIAKAKDFSCDWYDEIRFGRGLDNFPEERCR